MTPAQFGAALEHLRLRCSPQLDGVTHRQTVAARLKVSDREMRRWLNGASRIPGPVQIIAEWMARDPQLTFARMDQLQPVGSLARLLPADLHFMLTQLEAAAALTGFGQRRWDLRGDTHEWDGRLRAILGVPEDISVNHQVWRKLIDPEDRPMVEHAIENAMRPDSYGLYDMRYRVIRPIDGAVRLVRSRGQVRFENDKPIEIIAVILDITPASDVSAARLRQQQLQFSAALELACMGQYRFDLRTYKADWDIRTKQLFGVAPKSRVPAWAVWREAIYPQDLPHHEAILAQAMEPNDHAIDSHHSTGYSNRFRIVGFDGVHRNIGVRGHINFLGRRSIDIVGVIREVE